MINSVGFDNLLRTMLLERINKIKDDNEFYINDMLQDKKILKESRKRKK